MLTLKPVLIMSLALIFSSTNHKIYKGTQQFILKYNLGTKKVKKLILLNIGISGLQHVAS